MTKGVCSLNKFCNLISLKIFNNSDPYKIANDKNIIIVEESLGSVAGYFNRIYEDSKIIHLNIDTAKEVQYATLTYFLQLEESKK